MKKIAGFVLSVAALAMATPAAAQFQKPEDAVKYRQSAMSVMATHFGRIGAMANGRVPFDAKAVQDNARQCKSSGYIEQLTVGRVHARHRSIEITCKA